MDLRQTGEKSKKCNIKMSCISKQKGRSEDYNGLCVILTTFQFSKEIMRVKICVCSWPAPDIWRWTEVASFVPCLWSWGCGLHETLKRSSLTASYVLFRSSNRGQRDKSRTGCHLTAALYSLQQKQFPVENDCINQLHHPDLNHSYICFPDLMMWEHRVWRLALLHLVLCFSCTVNFAARARWRLRRTSVGCLPAAWHQEPWVRF